tara:strand:- start:3748 stop:4005 length:258 start_codon:yes stop_codon:yes gene_type:complete
MTDPLNNIFNDINNHFAKAKSCSVKKEHLSDYEGSENDLRYLFIDLDQIAGQMHMQYENEELNRSTLETAKKAQSIVARIINILE